MSAWEVFGATWDWKPSVVIGCAALLAGYGAALRWRLSGRAIWFASGVLLLLFSLVSPLDLIGERYLFSAHMLQHLLIVEAVPPLLILGLPPLLVRRAIRVPIVGRAERALSQPAVAWILGIGTLCVWHLPVLYNAALTDLPLHIAQHLLFLATATIFWWPVLTPLKERRLSLAATIPYLLAAAIVSTLLGIILTFAPADIYAAYVKPFDTLGILPTLREDWGLTRTADQQLGGLIMWVPGTLVYFGGILQAVMRWFEMGDAVPAPATQTGPAAGDRGAS